MMAGLNIRCQVGRILDSPATKFDIQSDWDTGYPDHIVFRKQKAEEKVDSAPESPNPAPLPLAPLDLNTQGTSKTSCPFWSKWKRGYQEKTDKTILELN